MKKPLFTLTLIITAVLFNACTTNNSLKPQKAILAGKIIHLDKFPNKTWLEFSNPELFGETFKLIEIDSSGNFRYEVELVSPVRFHIVYNQWIPMVISPNDSLYVTIDANIWNEKDYGTIRNNKLVELSGTIHPDYLHIIAFEKWNSLFYGFNHSKAINDATETSTFEEFKIFMRMLEKDGIKRIQEFGDSCNAGKLFYDIEIADEKYNSLKDLLRYWTLNPDYNGIERKDLIIPDDYLSVLKDYDLETTAFFPISRRGVVHEIVHFLAFRNHEVQQRHEKNTNNKKLERGSNAFFTSQAQYINTNITEITRNACLHYSALLYLEDYPEKSAEIYAAYNPLITDTYVKSHFNQEFMARASKVHTPIDNIDSKQYTALDSLITSHAGKVIYVEFWAPWCGPCMNEIDYAKPLKKELKGKNILFVNVGCRCSENSWKAAIANNDIEGVHLLLSDEDYAILSSRYKMPGIPHFLLVNKAGEITNNAPRPSNENTKYVIMELL